MHKKEQAETRSEDKAAEMGLNIYIKEIHL